MISNYTKHFRHLYNRHIRARDKEARFLVLISFLSTFIFARISVYGIKYHFLPTIFFHTFHANDLHIHHLVFGIILLLISGSISIPKWNNSLIRFSSILYGIGAALTLDEFALWLRLDPNAYFGVQGRISIDAVVIFALITFLTISFGDFWKQILKESISLARSPFKKINQQKQAVTAIPVMLLLIIWVLLFFLGGSIASLTNPFVLPRYPKQLSHAVNVFIQAPQPIAVDAPFTPYVRSLPAPTNHPSENDFCLIVPVLMYHHIQPVSVAQSRNQASLTVDDQIFNSQMAYLFSRGYQSITTDQLLHALISHTAVPQKSVVLTFDDGYEDNYTYAYPILKHYGYTGNFAVPTGLLGTHATTNDYFTWDQLKEMVGSGVINVVNHTWSHYPVGMGNVSKTSMEIQTPQEELVKQLGKHVTTFVYPYGYYQTWVFPLLVKNGMIGAFTTKEGMLQCQSFIMALPRTRIGNTALSDYGL